MIRSRLAAAAVIVASTTLALASCGTSPSSTAPDAAAPKDAAAEAAAALAELRDAAAEDAAADAAAGAEAPDASADAAAPSQYPGTSAGCPADMVLVNGNYCPEVNQVCIEHHDEYNRDEAKKKSKRDKGEDVGKSTVSERCLRYQEPSECLSKQRRPMRFCMDRFEWPNQKGELPALLISWVDAKKECENIGKRLCTEDEYNFACEGEQMLPYTYGYARDATKCNIDKQYRKREKKLLKYASCMKKPECKKELERLDQRLPAGSLSACVSPFGVYDLNGNINEWVFRPKEKPPNRSGLKGGWWGPVRGRCRPTVGFHKEEDYGYEEGFRCCKDAAAP
ncbi:MAG: SUMF1/EgtB/PvdO family nonheme iron enzyme [Minicystis sp.]